MDKLQLSLIYIESVRKFYTTSAFEKKNIDVAEKSSYFSDCIFHFM